MTAEPPEPPGHDHRGRRPQTTMNDLATAAGVSLKTVSRVINGEPGVTPATLKKVEEAGINEPVMHGPQAEPELESAWQPGTDGGHDEASVDAEAEIEM